MNLRTKNRFKLHRMWHEEPAVTMHFGTFVDDGTDPSAGGGGDGKGGTGDSGDAGDGKGGDGGSKGEGDDGNKGAKPSDAEAKLLKDLMKQKDIAKKASEELETLRSQIKQFEGIDPAKVRQLLANVEEEERKKAEARGEYDRLIKQMGDRHTEEIRRKDSELEGQRTTNTVLQSKIADLTVGTAFGNSSFVREELTLTPTKARVIYGAHFEFKDDKVIAYDKPAGASDRTPLVDATGNPLPFDQALKQIIEADPDKDHLIRSKAKPGAASGTEKPGSKGAKSEPAPMSSIERISKGLKALANTK